MLMPMRRAGFIFIVLIAAAIMFEPLLHTHPLSEKAQLTCAVCVNAVGRITPLTAAPIVPMVVVALMAALAVPPTILRAYRPLASRAPPAA